MPAAIVPALIGAGGSIGGGLLGMKSASDVSDAVSNSPAARAQTSLINQLRSQGSTLFNNALPGMQQTLGYYRTLLGGDRAARMGAVAPEAQDISAAYSGANDALQRNYVTGGMRDQAVAENARARAGQIGRLLAGVRPQAAQALSSMTGGMVRGAEGMLAPAVSGGAGLVGNATTGTGMGLAAGSDTARQIGLLISNLVNSMSNRSNRNLPNIAPTWAGPTPSSDSSVFSQPAA